ncbi:MAG: hypothetical protein U0002_06145 [Thermoanaerobaculia bacterium]
MRRPQYPLATVRRVREHAKEKAQEIYARRLAELAQEEEQLARCERALTAAGLELLAAAERTFELAAEVRELLIVDTHRLRDAVDFARGVLERRRGERQAQATRVEAAREVLEHARRALTRASQEVEAIDKHHQSWQRSAALASLRNEEVQRSELALNQWVQRREGEVR